MSLTLVNVSVAVLALTLVFGGPVGFLIKTAVTGKEPDEILQSLTCKMLPYEELLHEDSMSEKIISNKEKKAVHEKAIHGNENSGSSERRVS
ncbi:MAG: hypothetical protein ACI4D3_06515 [Lachnospiraceae bacterium]